MDDIVKISSWSGRQKVIEIHLAEDAAPEFVNKFRSEWPEAKITFLRFADQNNFHLITEPV